MNTAEKLTRIVEEIDRHGAKNPYISLETLKQLLSGDLDSLDVDYIEN